MNPDHYIGRQIRAARNRHGMSLDRLQHECGTAKRTLIRYESGEMSMQITKFLDICHILTLDPADVLDRAIQAAHRDATTDDLCQ